MATRIKIRRGTTAAWSTANPLLAVGEMGYDTQLKKFKIGDGVTLWNNLDYATGPKGDAGTNGRTILSGSGTPSSSVGTNGDFYINLETNDYAIYGPKTNDVWGNPTSLIGPQGSIGPKGDKGDTGDTGPQGATGETGATGSQGIQGEKGDKGDKGDQGNPGVDGADGMDGADGNTILNGSGTPDDILDGVDGDFYIDTTNNLIFGPKATGAWPLSGTSLVGPQGLKGDTGEPGPKGDTGDTGPQGPQGTGLALKGTVAIDNDLPSSGNTIGDGYIVEATGYLWTWNGTQWVSAGNIVGPEGPAGIASANAPVTYASATQTVGLSYGSGLTLSSNSLVPDFGTPVTSLVGATANSGTANTIARSDHQHERETFGTVIVGTAFGGIVSNGVATTVARSDHSHGTPSFAAGNGISVTGGTAAVRLSATGGLSFSGSAITADFGTPGTSTVGATVNTGTSNTIARSDHQHARENFGTTVVAGTVFGSSSVVGVAETPSRSDHSHGTPTLYGGNGIDVAGGTVKVTLGNGLSFLNSLVIPNFGTPVASTVGAATATGTLNTIARADHVHAREDFGTPGTSLVGATINAGTLTTVARADHQHARESFGTVIAGTTFGGTASNGLATTVSRSDHSHGTPSILNGNGISTAGGTVSVQITATNPGLTLSTAGLAADIGTAVAQVASGAHTHTGFVGTATSLITTSPLRIDNIGTANLSTNRTISVNTFNGPGNIGVVPNSTTNDVTLGKFLKADGTWAVPAGGSSTFESVGTITSTSGTITYDYGTALVWMHTSSPTADWIPSFTNVPETDGYSITFSLLVPQSTTAYKINNLIYINNNPSYVNWAGGVTPSGTNGSAVNEVQQFTAVNGWGSGDSYTFSWNNVTSPIVNYSTHNSDVNTSGSARYALNQLLGSGNWTIAPAGTYGGVVVTALATSGSGFTNYGVIFQGTLAATNVTQITLNPVGFTANSTTLVTGQAAPLDIWTFALIRTNGTWKILGTMSAGYA